MPETTPPDHSPDAGKMVPLEAVARALFGLTDGASMQPLAPWDQQYPSVRSRYLHDAERFLANISVAGLKVEAADAR